MITKNVVDTQDAPEEVKNAIFERYSGFQNDIYLEFFWHGEDDNIIYNWIKAQGVKEPNGTLIKYWW